METPGDRYGVSTLEQHRLVTLDIDAAVDEMNGQGCLAGPFGAGKQKTTATADCTAGVKGNVVRHRFPQLSISMVQEISYQLTAAAEILCRRARRLHTKPAVFAGYAIAERAQRQDFLYGAPCNEVQCGGGLDVISLNLIPALKKLEGDRAGDYWVSPSSINWSSTCCASSAGG